VATVKISRLLVDIAELSPDQADLVVGVLAEAVRFGLFETHGSTPGEKNAAIPRLDYTALPPKGKHRREVG
jgi:hypothetical protein